MEAIQLHDKATEEIVGTILITTKNSESSICEAWDKFQKTHSSNGKDGDIWDFVNMFPEMDMEVVQIDFYQP